MSLISALSRSLVLTSSVALMACGGGSDKNDTKDESNTFSPVVVMDPDPEPEPEPETSQFSTLVGIWDTSIEDSDGFGGAGFDEQYLVIREDRTAAIYDYQADGFGSGFNCYTKDTFRLIAEPEEGDYTFLPDDPTSERQIVNLSATTNFLNIVNIEFGDSLRAQREGQFLNETEFTPVCSAEQEEQPVGPGEELVIDGGGGGGVIVDIVDGCVNDGTAFNWSSNCNVSQSENAISSYTTAVQGVLWCLGYGSGSRDEFIDGVYGPITEDAVSLFQQDNDPFGPQTGMVNSITWENLQTIGTTDIGGSRYVSCDDVFFDYADGWYVSITGGIYQSMTAF